MCVNPSIPSRRSINSPAKDRPPHPSFPQSRASPGEKVTRNFGKTAVKIVGGKRLPPSREPARLPAGTAGPGQPRWRVAAAGWRVTAAGRRVAAAGRRVTAAGWRVAAAGWRVAAAGRWVTAAGRRAARVTREKQSSGIGREENSKGKKGLWLVGADPWPRQPRRITAEMFSSPGTREGPRGSGGARAPGSAICLF